MEGDVFAGGLVGRGGKLKREKQDSEEVQLTLEPEDIDDDGQISLTLDANGQYQFRATNAEQGAVTYRVVQVKQGDDGHLLSPVLGGISANQQAMIQGLVTEDDDADELSLSNVDETRLAYIPAALAGSSNDGVQETNATTLNSNSGQFYVMMAAPQELLQSSQHGILPRSSIMARIDGGFAGNPRGSRDDKRRATHNEVERRRRDKINTWITHLGKLVPDCTAEQSKQSDSKGGVLSKACDYIMELRTMNKQLTETAREAETMKANCTILRQQCEELRHENELLRAHLNQNGIEMTDLNGLGL